MVFSASVLQECRCVEKELCSWEPTLLGGHNTCVCFALCHTALFDYLILQTVQLEAWLLYLVSFLLLVSLLGSRQWLAIWCLAAAILNCVCICSSFVQVGLMWFFKTVAGYLKSARAVAEEEMYGGWSLKRQRGERLRRVFETVHISWIL